MDVEKNWATVKRGEVFRNLASKPGDWEFLGQVKYSHGFCELCGTEIVWQYKLSGIDSRQKSLWVGSECIKAYYEAYMPNGLELAIELMNKKTRDLRKTLIAEKIEEFKKTHAEVVDYLLGPDKRGYRDRKIRCFLTDGGMGIYAMVPVSKFRASIRRKGYLREDELEIFFSGYNNSAHGHSEYFYKMQLAEAVREVRSAQDETANQVS